MSNLNVISGTLNIGSGTTYDIILSDTSGNPTVFNQNRLNIDFAVSGTTAGDVLYFDASKGRLGINNTNPDAALHILTDCAYDGLKVENETNCATGVRILFVHNSQTPPETGSYPVTIDLAGRDNNYNSINYAQIKAKILDPASLQTSGEIIFSVDHTGISREVFRSSLVNTVLGGMNNVTGHFYDVIGYNNTISGLSYILLGNNNNIVNNTGIVIGNNNYGRGDKVLIVSNNSIVSGLNNIAFTVDGFISGLSNIGVGSSCKATGNYNIFLGNNTNISGNNLVVLVSESMLVGNSGIGFGTNIDNIGNNNIYIGNNINISGNNDIVLGSNANISGSNNIVYGNNSAVSGNDIINIGKSNITTKINSGIYIGSNINLSDSFKSVIVGLGTSTTSGLQDSILFGINNSTLDASPTGLIVIGQNNTVSNIKQSLVVGNNNNLSGNLANNIIIGPRNHVPINSNNNLIFGVLNNTSGIVISTDGSVSGTDTRTAGDAMSNTSVFGINNWISNASGALIVGNKSRVIGLNANTLGSYTNLDGNNIQNLGNSNFVIGNNISILGSYNDIIGSNSLSVNTSSERNQVFGSGNIVIGPNEVIVSGISIGYNNEVYGPLNSVYGNNNTVGLVRYPCRVSGTNIVIIGNINDFGPGDRVLTCLFSPASKNTACYVRTILDGVDPTTELPLGIIKQNTNSNYITTLVVNADITQSNTVDYYVKITFDDVVHGGGSPCDECFADLYAGYDTGYVLAFQDGNDTTDLITNPLYGNYTTVVGNNNRYTHSSGLVLGYSNIISGVNHIAIGNGIKGYYNNTVQIGSSNLNKLFFDNEKIVFNTGTYQQGVYFNSSNAGGANNDRVLMINLSTNRVGVNTTAPRSTLDVSGVLTTDRLRVKLSTVSGYSLIADASGEATWQFPVNLSGQNSGLLFKVTDKIGSGIRDINFNTDTREIVYLRADRDSQQTFLLDDDSIEERILIISPSGMFLNNPSSDYGYDFVVKGSGVQAPVDGDESVYLIKTIVDQNSIRIHNVTGVSGFLNSLTVASGLIFPVNLTGTILKVNNNGAVLSQSFDRHSLLFTHSSYASTGNNSLRYYPTSQAITIGTTGEPPSQAETVLQQGPNNTFNNIILGSSTNINTVFNNAGAGGNYFIIAESGQAVGKKGLQYFVNSGALGVGVDTVTNDWQVSSVSDSKYWYDAGKLVIDGKIRAKELQLTPNGKTIPGANSINKYLKIIDNAGNVGLDTIDLDYQFSGIHPLNIVTNSSDEIVTIRLATTTSTNINLGASDNGLMIVWDGAKWIHNKGFRFPQSVDNTDNTIGMEFGNDVSLNSCRNNHVSAGGSLVRNTNNWKGSSQHSKFYLRGRTLGDVSSELLADWHKNTSSTANINNTISLQYLSDANPNLPIDHNRTFVWNYTVNYSAVFSSGTPNGYGAVAGELKGAILSYRNTNGTRTTVKLGSDTVTQKRYNGVDYSTKDPIGVSILNDGNNINVQRLGVFASGISAADGLWSVEVDINQVFVPSGINFGNSDV
jgi:hypothetical protein